MTDKRIHLVFKTHLDIGFTDHAAKVRRQYHDQFIPQAIATGEHFFAEQPCNPQFIWTTGAWLIWDHLHSQDAARVKRLERAIERGLITWHALPFTTHTELMSPALFRAGLSYAQALDQRFGRKTIAAKMTDVPGHTLGIVPLLAEAGVQFLHLGVNTASPVPDVPPMFRWQASGGEEIVVMYQGSYGATDFPAGEDMGLSFAHTNDNMGPQSVGQAVEAIRHLQGEHPDAVILASTLDAFGAEIWARRETLPVITAEIGDSWVHGTASDPHKLARFRALQRVYDGFETLDEQRLAFGRGLTMVPEHTWGVDIKTYLRDEQAWDRADFEIARAQDYRFAYAEQSWAEQRAYLDQALDHLADEDRAAADKAIMALEPDAAVASPVEGTTLEHAGWSARLDPATGDITSLTNASGLTISGQGGSLIGFRHESYDSAELQKHLDSYLLHRAAWAVLDHDKPGLNHARTARTGTFTPTLQGVAQGNRAVVLMPDDAAENLGAARNVEIAIKGQGDWLELTLILRDKPANRMPEAGFLHIRPDAISAVRLQKMGLWHDSANQVRQAGGQLQAIEALDIQGPGASMHVTPLDCALVGPAGVPFMPFQPERPDWSSGARFNLYNNKWGTNFPMWWEGSIAFRFVITLRPS